MTDPVYPYRYEGVYTFRYENGDKTVTVEVGGEKTLPVMLEEIQYFLQACGYSFHLNEHIEVVDNSYSDEWADADLDSWEEEKDPHWQADGQQWQTNGWAEVDGPTEFGFNGTKESDFNVGNMRSDPVYGAIPPAPRSK